MEPCSAIFLTLTEKYTCSYRLLCIQSSNHRWFQQKLTSMLSRSWNRKPITGSKGPIEWFSPQRLIGYYWTAVAMAELCCDDTISLKSHNQKYDTYRVCKEALYSYFSNLLVRVCFRPLTLYVTLLQLIQFKPLNIQTPFKHFFVL